MTFIAFDVMEAQNLYNDSNHCPLYGPETCIDSQLKLIFPVGEIVNGIYCIAAFDWMINEYRMLLAVLTRQHSWGEQMF